MPRFVNNASWTHHFNTSLIVSISKGRKREKGFGYVHTAKLKDGGEIVIDGSDADELTDPVIAVIPAAAGYSTIATGVDEDEGPWTSREPVLAFQMTQSGEMRPVTIRGPNDGRHESVAVEQPSGEVWVPLDDAIYSNVDTWRSVILGQRAERLAETADAASEEIA